MDYSTFRSAFPKLFSPSVRSNYDFQWPFGRWTSQICGETPIWCCHHLPKRGSNEGTAPLLSSSCPTMIGSLIGLFESTLGRGFFLSRPPTWERKCCQLRWWDFFGTIQWSVAKSTVLDEEWAENCYKCSPIATRCGSSLLPNLVWAVWFFSLPFC